MNDLQRTPEWYLARKARVTASECYVLLSNRKEPMTDEELKAYKESNPKSRVTTKEVPFSTGTFTYLDDKVGEMYMPDDSYLEYIEFCKYENAAMRWGTDWESKAREEYANATGYEVLDAPFIRLKGYEKFAGGSPDGIIRYEGGLIEIKCPYNPTVHLRHFLYEKPEDLKEDNLQYYVQCQFNMMVCSREFGQDYTFCDFISYDPRTSKSKQLKVLRIPKDEEMQKELEARVALAVQYMAEKVKAINEASQIIGPHIKNNKE